MLLAVDYPEKSRARLDDEEILRRLSHVTGEEAMIDIRQMLERMKEQSPEQGYPDYRNRLLARMYDLYRREGHREQSVSGGGVREESG